MIDQTSESKTGILREKENLMKKFLISWFALTLVVTLLLFIAALALSGCVEKKMSLEEAKTVSVAMRQNDFTPPPRSVADVLEVLDQAGSFDPEITGEMKARADALPPDTDDSRTLANFYQRRGTAASSLGRAEQELADKRLALFHARKAKYMDDKAMGQLLRSLAAAEVKLGNFRQGQALCRESIEKSPTPSAFSLMAGTLFKTGDFDLGRQMVEKGVEMCNRRLGKASGMKALKLQSDRARLRAMELSALGKHKAAEPYWREYHQALEGLKERNPAGYLMSYLHLARNLKSQGRLVEAELLVRKGLTGAVAHSGRNSTLTAGMASFFAELLLKQGRLEDARKMAEAAMDAYAGTGLSPSATSFAKTGILLGEIIFSQRDVHGAAAQFDTVGRQMGSNQYIYNIRVRQNTNVILCNIMTGKTDAALDAITHYRQTLMPYFGKQHYKSAEILAFRGMVRQKSGQPARAFQDYAEAMPVLLKSRDSNPDFLKKLRQTLIVEAYMDLILDLHQSGRAQGLGLDAPAELFDLASRLNDSSVQDALGASSARAAAKDPELAALVRNAQDAARQIDVMKESLTDLAASPAQDKAAMDALTQSLERLTRARTALDREIQDKFPKYSEFTQPSPLSFSSIQEQLHPKEAMVVFFPASARTYIWGIPAAGKTRFAAAPLSKKGLAHRIVRLRGSLAPVPGTFSDIPEFDLALSYELFEHLFTPVRPAWEKASDLLIVAPGPLGQIPFGVMPMSLNRSGKPQLSADRDLLFDRYRDTDWFLRKVSITRLPSVSALATLRSLPPGGGERIPFVGFGDPIFNPGQIGQTDPPPTALASRGIPLRVRGIRKVKKAPAAETLPPSVTLQDLSRLPDTAEEIRSIARVTGSTTIFLGEEAAEARVKETELSNAKVVAFASHGLIPGDLDGLTQPAIALSSPQVTKDFTQDGLLETDEILKLDLNADWVVLSACNTGAAGGAGAEAVSGLGQAFFYAGSRALLVTMWSVESTSARKLTTGLFVQQNKNPGLSRARALQAAILDLMDNQYLEYDGKAAASYAHPFFWAPFIIVGDGG